MTQNLHEKPKFDIFGGIILMRSVMKISFSNLIGRGVSQCRGNWLTVFDVADFPEVRPRHHLHDESVGLAAAHPSERARGHGSSLRHEPHTLIPIRQGCCQHEQTRHGRPHIILCAETEMNRDMSKLQFQI
jgi:hypothetical protein